MEIIAHRGSSHVAPENTLAAVLLAWEEKADAVEVDVHLSRDHQLVVIHDQTTLRVAGENLSVAETTAAELKRLDVGRWKHSRYRQERIPLLEEVLAATPSGKRVFVEIKSGEEAIEVLQRCLSRLPVNLAQVAVISFDFNVVVASKKILPHCPAAWILERNPIGFGLGIEAIVARARDSGLDGVDLDFRWPVDAAVVEEIHRTGMKNYVYTVDDPKAARRLERFGVDGLTTNRPGWMRAQLEDPVDSL